MGYADEAGDFDRTRQARFINRCEIALNPLRILLIALVCFFGLAHGQPLLADEAPATQPAAPETTEAQDNPALPWLDKIDAAGKKLKSVQGTLRYELIQGAMGDKQVRMGSLFYDAKAPAKFAVHFDRLLAGRRLLREDRWYIFDGRWLVEKMGDQKQFIKRELVDPAAPEETVNPLADGNGPFALPITMTREQVLRKHRVALIADDKEATDENESKQVHLRLTPHVAQRGEFTQIDLWYDTQTLLPVRVETLDETENQTAILLSNVKVDQDIPPAVFDTTPPRDEGWTVEIKKWE